METDINRLLEKEKPKTPIKISKDYLYYFKCPNCNEEIIYGSKFPRCAHCGQVLDWEKYDESMETL